MSMSVIRAESTTFFWPSQHADKFFFLKFFVLFPLGFDSDLYNKGPESIDRNVYTAIGSVRLRLAGLEIFKFDAICLRVAPSVVGEVKHQS